MSIVLLLVPGCDIKVGGDPADSGDGWAHSTGVSSSGGYLESGDTESVTSSSATHPCPTESGDTESPVSTLGPGDSGDTETPVNTSGVDTQPDSGDTETPVSSTSTSSPGGDADSGAYESDGGSHSTGVPEEDACGWGAGGNEDGTWCALSISCRDQPEREMRCDDRTCVCLVDGVEVGSCDADEVCLDLGHVQDKGPACCGFPALSP